MTTRKNTEAVMKRQDMAALAMNPIELDNHLEERRNQIAALSEKADKLHNAIDTIVTFAGRASAGHDKDCECTYCLIYKVAYKAWKVA